jgi:transcriptional regulator with XRE-family HTH domain
MPSVRTRRKSKLGTHLTKLRIAARLEQSDVAAQLRKSFATLSKIENGHVLPDYPTLTLLLTVYDASDEDRQIAEDLREEARQESKRVEHSSGMPPKFRAFLRAEMDAATERTLQPNSVPGLLQTPAYAKAVNDTMSRFVRSEFDAQRAISSRLRRQERLRGADPLELHAIVDESAIVRVVGDKTLMTGQLRYLLDAMELPNVDLQVIPFEAGAYGPMSGGVTILGFPEELGDPDVLYLEYPRGGEWIENQDDVTKFIGMFDDASGLALSVEESATLIRAEIERLEKR